MTHVPVGDTQREIWDAERKAVEWQRSRWKWHVHKPRAASSSWGEKREPDAPSVCRRNQPRWHPDFKHLASRTETESTSVVLTHPSLPSLVTAAPRRQTPPSQEWAKYQHSNSPGEARRAQERRRDLSPFARETQGHGMCPRLWLLGGRAIRTQSLGLVSLMNKGQDSPPPEASPLRGAWFRRVTITGMWSFALIFPRQ